MKNKIEAIANKRGYCITENGDSISPTGSKIGYIGSTGYRQISIRANGSKKILKAHRLQAFQKYGNDVFADGILVRHKDGNKLNNSWDNILIGTDSDNMMDIPEQIRIKKAIHAASSLKKYNNKEVIEYHEKHGSYKKTMDRFNISSKGTLYYILKSSR